MPIPPPKHTVSCLCGAEVRVDPLLTDRRVTCPACNSPLDFIVSMDAKLKKPRVSIVIPMGLMRTEGASLGSSKRPDAAPPPPPPPPADTETAEFTPSTRTVRRSGAGKTVRGVIAQCACGGSFPVNEEELTSIQSCPQCGVSYHVVVKRDEDKKRSAILVPVKPVGRNAGSLKTMTAPPKALPGQTRAKARTQNVPAVSKPSPAKGQTVAKTGRVRVTKVPPPAAPSGPPPEAPPGAQAVACPCGEYVVVRRKDVDKGLTCEHCGRRLEFQTVRDPQSLAPIIRVR